MFDFGKLISDPRLFWIGISLSIASQILCKFIHLQKLQSVKTREILTVLMVSAVLLPVYIQNSNFFTISPDSQGYLRSPEENTTYRPPLLWLVYRIFSSQESIDRFFRGNPISGEKLTNPDLLAGSNFIVVLYLISTVVLYWTFYRYLKVDTKLILIATLTQTSGPLYFLSDYYFIPPALVPYYRIVLYALLTDLLINSIKRRKELASKSGLLKKLILVGAAILLLLISSRAALMVVELNQIMTETLTMVLINLTLSLVVILISVEKTSSRRIVVTTIGFCSGLLSLGKLSTILTPAVICIVIFLLKFGKREKLILTSLLVVSSIFPPSLTTVTKTNSESSQTWYGLVSYAIEFQKSDPVVLNISNDAKILLELAIKKRDVTWVDYPEVVSQYRFIYQKTAIALYDGALPAATELGLYEVSSDHISNLFKEITIASFSEHKKLVALALLENLRVPPGIFKLDGQYMSLSKIVKNPIVYFLFVIVLMGYFSKQSYRHNVIILLMLFFVTANYVVVSIFNGHLARYFYLYDPLVLYIIVLMFSRVTFNEKACEVKKLESN